MIEHKITINRSIFIANLIPVTGEDDAINALKTVKKKYADATHNVYAYIANIDGSGIRFSDDGEPQGTAAAPMLETLKKRKIVGVLAVVTRYFGGIKLGAGGLVQAYVRAVAETLDSAKLGEYSLVDIFNVNVPYNSSKATAKLFEKDAYSLIETDYSANVRYTLALVREDTDIITEINDATQGRAIIEKIKQEYILTDMIQEK